ncbi:BspA family leucine-rich repeat surface protein [Pediococcus acidilactici]|uniref:BspA family leucine-rich repeat surface protein n=1 Tax=Pediococcus acidilactici TaxID=1254 RepID=UPI001310FEA6|nr:BspA family leucine-rich repeat surface protein [Pediococcus acidilactici]KAF0340502.1 BspA family leucine-rich repeat surface protein [Pediococcus acidilactici]KAF0352422.1 BspA family leucine-rich repeat surface protein [Pediococcus acidilactici]KAF0356257.1 BspA family leucine-rich repeat surface protein [Pediococcus acidilactici]KAF0360874.1 BspA family leucine-rich repeat surface protein [Pediococcus acidilactici]KAF0374450.1 BspA family leucine-rich repeat surface protein [Pediococcus
MVNNLRYIIKKCLVIAGAIIATLLITTQLAMAAQKNVRGTAIEWGNSTWALADDGELMSMGGDIGQAPPLHDVLSNNGIEPGQVKSIEFTKATSAHDITDMLGNLPNLQKITKISNFHYSGNGDQMFRDNTVLESIDFKGFDTSKITSMSFMFFNTGFKSLDLSGFDTSQVTSMYGMFDNAGKLSSLNIKNFDTRKVDSMGFMFNNVIAHDLDVSSFNTSNVNNMEGMFDGTSVDKLDLRNFDTSKVGTMEYMFLNSAVSQLDISSFTIGDEVNTSTMLQGTNHLKQLALGKKSQLKDDMNIPDVPTTDGYTGHWQNVGNGTIDDPAGSHVWTSAELMSQFDAPTMGDDTFVWQRKPAIINIGEITDYKNDPVLSKYVPTAVDPLHPYRYNVVLNNDYPFYTKVEDGQMEKDNVANLGDKSGATVYSQAEMPGTYTYPTSKRAGQAAKFIKVSFDGSKWYWVDQHALNLDLKSRYPAVNDEGIALIDDQFLGSTNTYGIISGDFNSQMIDNAYNPDGQIIYQSFAKEIDFTAEKDPTQALKAFNDNLDRAAKSWNDALGEKVFIKATDTDKKVTLKVVANPQGAGNATLSGNTGIDVGLVKWALDPDSENYDINLLFLMMRHELGHNLGLNHTSNGQYYGMPDGYKLSIDDDVMNAILYHYENGYPITQKTITKEDVSAIKLILSNHNFENPQPQTKKVVTTKQIDRAVSKS